MRNGMVWLGVLLLAAIAGCRAPETARTGNPAPLRIVMIAKAQNNPVFLAAHNGARAAARELGEQYGRDIVIDWQTPAQENAAQQAAAVTAAAATGADAILLSCSETPALVPALEQAARADIPVMTFDSDAPEHLRFAFCGSDDARAGELLLEEMATLLGGRGRIAVLAGNAAAPNLQRRVAGVKRALARHRDLRLTRVYHHPETAAAACETMRAAQRRQPGIRGWVLIGGWPLYDSELGNVRELATIPIVSMDALPMQLPYVENGQVQVLLAQDAFAWGETGVRTIVARLLDGTIPPSFISLPLTRVTRATLPQWREQLERWEIMGP